MISQFTNRQGFGKSLSGVPGSAIQSAYAKPLIDPSYALSNISWLPYPYGPLPDKGPWIDKEDEAHKENPTPGGPTPGAQGSIPEKPISNVLMFLVVVGAAWFLAYYRG